MKRFLILLLILVAFVLPVVPSYAAMQEDDLEYIDTQKDVVFWVSWDVEKPQVQFVAPDGAIYDPQIANTNTTTVNADKSFYYVVKAAAVGQWRVKYDKGKNSEIEISVHDYNAGLSINYFTLDAINNTELPVKFSVSGAENTLFKYRISAVVDHSGAEKLLTEGSAYVGDEEKRTLYLNDLSSYSAYMLKLYVWYDDNGTDIFDFAFSKAFSYTNPNVDKDKKDFKMTVIPNESLIDVEWPDLEYGVDTVIVALFEDDAKEPAFFDEYDVRKNKKVQLSYDPKVTKISVEFTPKKNGLSLATNKKTADVGKFALKLPEGEGYNSLVMPMKYDGFKKQQVDVTVNDHKTELVLDGKGSVNITFGNDWNTLKVMYQDSSSVFWKIERRIYVDTVAPTLSMNRAYDKMTVDDKKITIAGIASDCNTVKVNGEAVKLDKSGAFSKDIELKNGENIVEVTATDGVGNESRYTAAITRGYAGTDAQKEKTVNTAQRPGGLFDKLTAYGSYWILIAVSVICLLGIGYVLLFWRKGGKK